MSPLFSSIYNYYTFSLGKWQRKPERRNGIFLFSQTPISLIQ
ncbi:hypothetical protein HMPREF1150_0290 [Streptococcus sp. AS14]|nr:hypothetical protein HMPREF1150_0290 [Streptococcus sp. AS14]